MKHLCDLQKRVRAFCAKPDASNWPERRDLATEILRQRGQRGIALKDRDLRRAISLLAGDHKWEVRRVVALTLGLLPDEDFQALAGKLTSDPNAYVKQAAEASLNRHRLAARESRKARATANQVDQMLEVLERQFGCLAATRARRICDKQTELVVGAVAHDLRNILTSLKAAITIHLDACTHKGTGRRKGGSPERIMENLDFLEGTIMDMSNFAQELPEEMLLEDVSEVINSALDMARTTLGERGADVKPVRVKLKSEIKMRVQMARRLIVVALSHVIKNAFEVFMDAEGVLAPGEIRIRSWVEGNDAVISVANNGPGLDEDDLADLRAFLPRRFNKMKKTSRGFGLPTAYRYVLHHGGTLTIDSPRAKGAVVTLRLPVTQDLRVDV